MTTANVNVTKVLLKRGNTVQNNNYTGVSGELTIDTQLKTLRVHDGVTAGGNVIVAGGVVGSYSNTNTAAYLASQSITSANIGAFQTFANANAAAQATSINTVNANIGAYQTYANSNAATQATSIDSINANVGAFQTLANANAATQTTEINSLRANITAANTAITSLTSNAAIQATLLDTLTGNAATQSQVLDTLTSNAAAQATSLTTLLGNAVAQQTSLIDLVANAAVQAQAIANVTGTYGNANVATYLSAFDGNILPSANVTYSLGSETRQWRDLWVSNNTIYIGNTPIRVDGGTLLVNGAPVSGGSTYGNANVATYLPTYTGNIAGNIVKNGYTWTFGTGGNLTVPASGIITAPNSQEFRLQARAADSVLRNEIELDPNNGTYMSVWSDELNTSFSTGAGSWATASWNNEEGLGAARFTDAQALQNFWLTGPGSIEGVAIEASINGGARTPNVFYENNNGETYGVYLGLDAVPPGGQGTTVPITSLVFYYRLQSKINIDVNGGEILLDAQAMDIDLRTTLNLDLRAGENLNLRGLGQYPVRIYTDNSTHMWEFDTSGSLTLPSEGKINGIGAPNDRYGYMSWTGNTSGDGSGYNTMRLVPDLQGLEDVDTYIILDPAYDGQTGNIHIRAGGTRDNSLANLYLGGANSHVKIGAGSNPPVTVMANSQSWTFSSDGSLILPGANADYTIATQSGYITVGNLLIGQGGSLFNSNNDSWALYGNISDPGTSISIPSNASAGNGTPLVLENQISNVEIRSGFGTWTFGNTGTTTFPTNISIDYSAGNVQFPRIIADSGKAFSVQSQGNIGSAALAWTVNPNSAGQYAAVAVTKGGGDNLAKVVLTAQADSGDAATAKTWVFNQTGTTRFPDGTILAPAGQNITMQSDQYSQLYWQNANVTVAPDMAINSNFYVAQNSATLDIVYRDGSSTQQQKSWIWSVDGSLTLPAGGTITEGGGISGAIRLTPAGGANSNQALVIYPTAGAPEGDHVHLTTGGGSTELYLGNDFHYVKLVDGGNIELRAATANLSSQAAWTFDTTGNIDTIQALGIKVPNGVPTNVAVINSTTGSWELNPRSDLATTGGSGSGLTVNVTETGGYASTIAIATAGTGYTNGDLITVTSGSSNATFTIVIGGRNTWQFGTDGATTLPGDIYSGTGAAIKFSKGLEGDVDGAHLQVSNITFLPNVSFEDIPGLNLGLATAPAIGWTMQSMINSWTANGAVNVSSSTLAAPYSDSGNIGTIALGGPSGTGSIVWAGETDRYALSGNTLAYEPYGNIKGLTVGSSANVIITSNVGPVESFRWIFGANANLTLPETGYLRVGSGIVAGFASSPAPVISGFSSISAENFRFQGNGVNILSAVGAGSYSNTQVASYLLNFDGDIEFTSSTARIGNVDVITVGDHIRSPAYQFSNGTSILAGITGTYSNTNVAAYLTTATITTTGNITAGNVSAVNFVGTIQAQVGSSFAYATDAYGSLFNTGGVPLPADTNSNAIVAGYTIVGNSGAVTLTVTSATFIPGTPNIVQVATTPTASSLAYPVTVYSADYSPAIPVSTITVGNATVSGNVIAPNYLFANGASILAGITGTYSNTNVAAYLTTATITTTGNVTAANIITSGATSGNISGANYISANAFQVTNGIFWSNGTAWSSAGGGTTYSNANVAAYLTAGNISVGTAGFTVLPNIVAQFTSNVNSYGQVNMQNINSGTDATTEIIATANNGTDTIFFVDMGIAGNTYDNTSPSNSLGTIIYANDAYLYAQGNTSANVGGNLAVGAATAGRSVTIFAGGINNSSNVATFANTGVTVYGNITAANIITTGTYGNITNANVIFANTVVGNNNTLTLGGNITQTSAYFETYSNVVNTGGNITFNFANTSVFYATLTANVTANIVGLANNISTVTGFTVIVDQGATPYRIANIQFNGGATSNIRWIGTTVPTGTASNTDIISISLINLGNGTYRILGQQSSYG
jgi:hypothetical protein